MAQTQINSTPIGSDTIRAQDPPANSENFLSLMAKTQANFTDLYTKLGLEAGFVPDFVYLIDSNNAAHTLAAASVVGGSVEVDLNMTGSLAAGANLQLPTVAAVVAALANFQPGVAYRLRILNSSAGAFAWTITTNTGWTLNGTMTIAQNTYRDFILTFTNATTAVLQSTGQVAFSAL